MNDPLVDTLTLLDRMLTRRIEENNRMIKRCEDLERSILLAVFMLIPVLAVLAVLISVAVFHTR